MIIHKKTRTREELVEAAQQQPLAGNRRNSEATGESATEFTCTHTYDEALNLLRYGWPEGTARIKELSEKLQPRLPPNIGRRIIQTAAYNDSEGELDVERYTAGEHDCWLQWEGTEAVGNQIVRLRCNVTASGVISAEQFYRRGAIAAAIVDTLEQTGRRVEVEAWEVSRDRTKQHEFQFDTLIKRADEPVELDALAFALAHPSMLRRIYFRMLELEPDTGIRMGDYGIPAMMPDEERAINIERMYASDDDALAFALEQIKKIVGETTHNTTQHNTK